MDPLTPRVVARWLAASGLFNRLGNLEVKPNGWGKGLFTKRPYAKGETICLLGGPVPAPEGPSFQVGARTYMGPSGGFQDDLNHSCEPNCAAMVERPGYPVVTLRPIEAGEEVTIDYSVTSTNPSDGLFECKCGKPSCRGMAGGGFHSIPARQQRRYLALGIVPGYVLG